MEAPHLTGNGNTSQRRKCCKVALYTSIFVLIVISFLVSTVFYLLQDKEPQGTCWAHGSLKTYIPTENRGTMIWEWSFKHCQGLVKDRSEYLIIMENGNYFIYAQINRETEMNESFTLLLHKKPGIILNEAVGPNKGGKNGTVNFGRPFYLQKGDELYCELNVNSGKILLGEKSYWGLYKI
uniref:THD domain-containing protein n=1 Tax=Meleagris gallopavo TaxID=9103 RepID=A0A803XUF3_MELGA